jgi:hypothetical protein
MGARPDESLIPTTRRLDELLACEDGTSILALLQRLGLDSGHAAKPQPIGSGGSLEIGVWTPEVREDGSVEFLRSQALAGAWPWWADLDRIAPKCGTRTVLLGESVARGYLFDPAVTPAVMLEHLLGSEVVDLARTDLARRTRRPRSRAARRR